MKDLLFDRQRADSLLVDCEYCGQPVSQPCVNQRTGQPIEHQAAHLLRLAAVRESVSS